MPKYRYHVNREKPSLLEPPGGLYTPIPNGYKFIENSNRIRSLMKSHPMDAEMQESWKFRKHIMQLHLLVDIHQKLLRINPWQNIITSDA